MQPSGMSLKVAHCSIACRGGVWQGRERTVQYQKKIFSVIASTRCRQLSAVDTRNVPEHPVDTAAPHVLSSAPGTDGEAGAPSPTYALLS